MTPEPEAPQRRKAKWGPWRMGAPYSVPLLEVCFCPRCDGLGTEPGSGSPCFLCRGHREAELEEARSCAGLDTVGEVW